MLINHRVPCRAARGLCGFHLVSPFSVTKHGNGTDN